ncbi:cysteinyl leukotriene receptor 1 isoform X2 [Hemicordylus capensis]|nr:cysteinyl leukotriene receptor 1 isoform X2 [Hemicordylus capensis]XP_053129236.1 cysteinyl leukotriene receptor 1 isoform X2 [Hemicordylus capensis]
MLQHQMDSMAAGENVTSLAITTNVCADGSIDEFRYQVYPLMYSVICILGFLGNGLVLCVLIKTYQEKTAFRIYMINLAISDLLFVCTLPLRVIYFMNGGNWLFGDFMCRVSSYTLYVNLYCSIFFMTAMSFFRCRAIVFPIQNLQFITEKKARLLCVAIWLFVTLTSTPFLVQGTYKDDVNNKTKCLEPPENHRLLRVVVLHYISLLIGFIFPLVTIAACYAMIIRTLLKNALQKKEAVRKKAVWMIIIVTLTFLLSFTPYHIQRTVHLHFLMRKDTSCADKIYMQKSVVITLSMAAFNCCFDPLLYFFSGSSFRQRLRTLRKSSASSMSQSHRIKMSLKNLNDIDKEEAHEEKAHEEKAHEEKEHAQEANTSAILLSRGHNSCAMEA